MAYHLGIFLLGTFYEDLVTFICHLHRIETNDLADGLFDGKIAEMTGNCEVFQFIIDKGDVVVCGLRLNIFQGFGKGIVLKGVCDLLCACN